MRSKFFGAIFMLLGTCIGAGMLALPLAGARESIFFNCLLLTAAWFLMTAGAFAILEVNLWLPEKSNLVSMAHVTLGKPGKYFAWTITLLLLYSLLSAYIASASDVLYGLLKSLQISSPHWLDAILALLLLSYVVLRGIRTVDLVNRNLLSVKLIAFFIVVFMVASPNLANPEFITGDHVFRFSSFMVMITSFGYATIIPSLRTYLCSDKQKLANAIILGSLLPLIIYIIWMVTVNLLVARYGDHGLIAIATSNHATEHLIAAIDASARGDSVKKISNIFISICALTSFLGVALSLWDFLADGLAIRQKQPSVGLLYIITFLPPLCFVLFEPGIFITALSYAGILCVLLLILLPVLMCFSGRHIKNLSNKNHGWFSVLWLMAISTIAIVMVVALLIEKI